MWIIKVWLQSGFLLEQKKKKKMEIRLVCWANTSTDKGETMWEWAHHHDPLSPDLETRSPHNAEKMQNIQNIPGHKTNMFPSTTMFQENIWAFSCKPDIFGGYFLNMPLGNFLCIFNTWKVFLYTIKPGKLLVCPAILRVFQSVCQPLQISYNVRFFSW